MVQQLRQEVSQDEDFWHSGCFTCGFYKVLAHCPVLC
jgi:hypothetical protein